MCRARSQAPAAATRRSAGSQHPAARADNSRQLFICCLTEAWHGHCRGRSHLPPDVTRACRQELQKICTMRSDLLEVAVLQPCQHYLKPWYRYQHWQDCHSLGLAAQHGCCAAAGHSCGRLAWFGVPVVLQQIACPSVQLSCPWACAAGRQQATCDNRVLARTLQACMPGRHGLVWPGELTKLEPGWRVSSSQSSSSNSGLAGRAACAFSMPSGCAATPGEQPEPGRLCMLAATFDSAKGTLASIPKVTAGSTFSLASSAPAQRAWPASAGRPAQ